MGGSGTTGHVGHGHAKDYTTSPPTAPGGFMPATAATTATGGSATSGHVPTHDLSSGIGAAGMHSHQHAATPAAGSATASEAPGGVAADTYEPEAMREGRAKGAIAAITDALKEAVTINPPPGPHNARA